ncbi:hypothetical protein [Paenibacillus anseongense]|uniref:hypothetical protein n=1 Tax=Paenibacillus anseongense TaxID=2682845 RepID=UPI002DBF10E1|nr:hypothetical protein [Paenibacillus anseongense]MEC0265166.1 hypothetical protein [Paenibacillus anseongense]
MSEETKVIQEFINEKGKRERRYKRGNLNVTVIINKEMSEQGIKNFNKRFNDMLSYFQ